MKNVKDQGLCIVNPEAAVKFPTREALPPCEGPKLSRFDDARQPVQFLGVVSDPGVNEHSHVFEVRIGGKIYALKVFHFYDPLVDFYKRDNLLRYHLRHGDLIYHLDPFFVECRAYGRINQTKKSRSSDIAVRAFGHLSLPARLEDKLAEDYGIDEWNRPDDEYEKPPSRRTPFRAIVKELVRQSNRWDERSTRKMLRDLRQLRKLGVYPMDVKADNYVDNKLVDFSASCTEPSLLLSTKPEKQELRLRNDDLKMFDEMMEEEGIHNAPPAFKNEAYCEKLRSYSRGRWCKV